MNANIALSLAIAVVAMITSGLAGHLAATKPWHKWVFWGGGLIMLLLIMIQTYKNETDQHGLRTQLDKIQKQTEQPPKISINIPPQLPTPQEPVVLETETIVTTKQLIAWRPLSINFYLLNRHAPVVDGIYRVFLVKLIMVDPTQSDRADISAHSGFLKEALALQRKWQKEGQEQSLDAGKGLWNTITSEPLTKDKIDGILRGTLRVYTYIWARWKKEPRDLDECTWLQAPPSTSLNNAQLVWRNCTIR